MNLRTYRESKGLTGRDAAKQLGISGSRVSQIEYGAECPVKLAMHIEAWSGGAVSASTLSPDVALVRSRLAINLVIQDRRVESVRVVDDRREEQAA